MPEPRIWTMIVLSSLIAAPAIWFINEGSVMQTGDVRSSSTMYHLVSANSGQTEPGGLKAFVTAEHWRAEPRNSSDFPVSGRYQFARKAAPDIVSDQTGLR